MAKERANSVREQLTLFGEKKITSGKATYFDRLTAVLKSDLNFHRQDSLYFSHNFHSFPAKFPPQLPKLFINELTTPGDVVLDPMVGSGTTIVEAFLAGRKAIGFDIDPLAIKLSAVKTTPVNRKKLMKQWENIYLRAQADLTKNRDDLQNSLNSFFDPKTKAFVDYWFLPEIQLELFAILQNIRDIKEDKIRNFFEVIFSSIIITKSGGVSLALDLGHTRPHKAKILLDKSGNVVFGEEYRDSARGKHVTKMIRSPLEEFEKKFHQTIKDILVEDRHRIAPEIRFCDAQQLCLTDETVDLIVTSPPYASNAIDYMRAHKFSLVWFGYSIDDLTTQRKSYIGGESTTDYPFEAIPGFTSRKVSGISEIDPKKGNILRRYFTEMTGTLREMYRVLRPQKAAIVVVGSSVMKGIDTETHLCLAEIGEKIGFRVPYIGVRKLDRNKRMLPAGSTTDLTSQIQKRMHEEYVIGFYKP